MRNPLILLLLLLITAMGVSAQTVGQFSYSQFSACVGDTVIVTNQSVLDTGEYITWSFDGNVTALNANDTVPFMVVTLNPDSTVIGLSIYDSTNTFVAGTSATIYIHALPSITNVTPTNGMITCSTPILLVTIMTDTTVATDSIVWMVNGSNVGWSPLSFPASIADTGTFNLVAISQAGCVAVNPYTYTITDGTTPPTVEIGACGTGVYGSTIINCMPVDICANITDSYPPIAFAWSNGSTGGVISVDSSGGSYGLTITNANGCTASAIIPYVWIGTPIIPFGFVTNTDSLCNGETVTLAAPLVNGLSYLWTNGQTTPSIIVGIPGNYAVEISNGICSYTANAGPIDFHALPETNLIASNCSIGLASAVIGDFFQWFDAMSNPIFGANGPSYGVTAPGYFSVQVTSAFGCMSTSSLLPVQCVIISSVGDQLQLQSDKSYTASIIDIQGRVLKTKECHGDATIDMQDLIPGIYIVRIEYPDHRVDVQKVYKF